MPSTILSRILERMERARQLEEQTFREAEERYFIEAEEQYFVEVEEQSTVASEDEEEKEEEEEEEGEGEEVSALLAKRVGKGKLSKKAFEKRHSQDNAKRQNGQPECEPEHTSQVTEKPSREMREAAQEAKIQATIISEEQQLAALVAKKASKGKLLRKDQRRMNVLLRSAMRREGQPTGGISEVNIGSTVTAGPEDNYLALAVAFTVVPETVVPETVIDGKDNTAPVSIVRPVEHHPKAGRSFMIRTRKEPHFILTLENGELRLLSQPTLGGGSFWHCIKSNGWYTFRNSVSGTYLNHDGEGKISAKQSHQKMHECFLAERHEDGGYILLMRHGDDMSQVAISEYGKWLAEKKEGGTAWDFIEAKYVCSSMTLTSSSLGVAMSHDGKVAIY